jgi:hypothetical protein
VHKFDSGQNNSCCSKRLEAEHRLGDAFDGTMILLHDIVEILDLPDLDQDYSLHIQLVEPLPCCRRSYLLHRVRDLVVPHGFAEEAPSR